MSNLVLANLAPAASAQQPDRAVGQTTVNKKDLKSEKTQIDVQQQAAPTKDGLQADSPSPRTLSSLSFKALLQKRLTNDSANDKSDTLSKKHVIINNGVTTEKQKTKTTDKETKESTNPLLSAAILTQQPLDISTKKQMVTAVTASKSLPNQHLKAIQSTGTAAPETKKAVQTTREENAKVIVGKEVTEDKITAKEAKLLTAVEHKEVKNSAEIKDVPAAKNAENSSPKAAVTSQMPDIAQPKQTASQNTINLSIDPGTAGKDKPKLTYSQTQVHTNKEDTKVEKDSPTVPKIQTKAKVTANPETSDVTHTVTTSSQTDVSSSVKSPDIRTEVISAKQVTAAMPERAHVQSTTLPATEQIIDKVQNVIIGSTQQIQVTLTPAELGAVRITFRQQDGQVEGLMEIQNPEVRKEVEKALPQIAAALAQNGIQVRRMDVAPMTHQQSNPDSYQSPEHEFNSADQHSLGYNANSSGSGTSGERFSGRDVPLVDGMQDPDRSTYELSGLNLFA